MNAPSAAAPTPGYESAGRQVALAVRAFSSVVVASDDPVAAAQVAIGIAVSESMHRMVMIGDLAGEVAPLQSLVPDDDSHGIYDAFAFGTSFGKLARKAKGNDNLFILPSGTESAVTEEVMSSRRWRHFASEFAKADELLLLATFTTAPGLADLVAQVDGVVLVGLQRLDAAPGANVLARVSHPPVGPPPRLHRASPRKTISPRTAALAAAGLLALGVAGGAALGRRQGPAPPERISSAPAPIPDSIAAESTAVTANSDAMPANPQDSATATAYSVQIVAANTAEGANIKLQQHGNMMPAATISLVPVGDTEAAWYKVYAGAFADSVQAHRLLESLRDRGIISPADGIVVRAPLALLVDSVSPQAGVMARAREKVHGFQARGVAVYPLIQPDGSARLYAGAFARPEESALAATALRVAGVTPVLAYRTGRIP